MNTNLKLSIIIPTYNEKNTIEEILRYVQAVDYPIDYEIIVVDDASVGGLRMEPGPINLENNSRGRVRIFRNRINQGKGFSVRRGIKEVMGDIVIIQDADKEYNPQDIPRLLQPILNHEADVVYGSRFLKKYYPTGMAFRNFLANRFLTQLANLFFGLKLTDMETCYKVFRADILKSLPLRANRFTFEPEVTALLAKRNIRIQELPIQYHGRSAQEGKKIKAKDFFYAMAVLFWHRLKG